MAQSGITGDRLGIDAAAEGLLEGQFTLPPLPEVVTRLLAAIREGGAEAADIAEIIGTDAGLVAEILKIVNSAYYALPRRIAEVRHAVAYLGLSEIERLAYAASVMRQFEGEDRAQLVEFWRHSFYCALVSKLLLRRDPTSGDSEETHTAALLHDVGKLVYLRFFPAQYAEITKLVRAEGLRTVDAERRLGLPSHTAFGVLLAERWKLPDCVHRACLHHELEDLDQFNADDRYAGEIRLICLSNAMVNLTDERLSAETKSRITSTAVATLDCGEEEFLLLMGEVYELKTEVDAFLAQLLA